MVSATTTTGTSSATGTTTYDANGNTSTRSNGQTFTWDPHNRVTAVTGPGASTYVYTADGDRLLRRDTTAGTTTLYLGDTDITATTATGTKTATRYYTFNDTTVATRTSTGLTLTVTDPHNSGTHQINASTNTITATRPLDPFGKPRTTTGTWTGTKGFVNGTQDPTGFTQLGARLYNPDTGKFLTTDPLADPTDPQQLNGYAYADNNPITNTDPTGLMCAMSVGSGVCNDWQYHQGIDPKIFDNNKNRGGNSKTNHRGNGKGGGTKTSKHPGSNAKNRIVKRSPCSIVRCQRGYTYANYCSASIGCITPSLQGCAKWGCIHVEDPPLDTIGLAIILTLAGLLGGAADSSIIRYQKSKAGSAIEGQQGSRVASKPEGPTVAYNRQTHYGGAATNSAAGRAIRVESEGRPCPSCGTSMVSGTKSKPVSEHDPPLVEHYYEHGGWQMSSEQARAYARSPEAFNGAMCATCQAPQGANSQGILEQ